jgi:hypothetical protein
MATALKIQSYQKPIELIKKEASKEAEILKGTQDVFELLGWNTLPERLQSAVYNDVQSFSNELVYNYSTIDTQIKERKKRIYYWIGQFKAGHCSEDTVVEMLIN